MSYAYKGREASMKLSWDQVILHYRNQDSIETAGPQEVVSSNSTGPADLLNVKADLAASSKAHKIREYVSKSAWKCDDSTSGFCACLRTTRIPIRPKWMIGSRGQVGLVPSSTKEGDIICHFQNSDVTAIVRPFGDGWFHSIIGGAIIIRQWDEEPVKIHERSSEVFKYSVGTRRRDFAQFRENYDQMSFHFDRTCLRPLTCPQSDLGPFANDWTPFPAPLKDHWNRNDTTRSIGPRSRSKSLLLELRHRHWCVAKLKLFLALG
jgi:hypothetical protein